MTRRWTLCRVAAIACALLPEKGLRAGGRLPDAPPELPAMRIVWPLRTSGADLFAPRNVATSGIGNGENSDRGGARDEDCPFVLVDVRRDVGEIRLIGHTGAGRSLRGVFALPDGGSVLARAGEPVGSEGLTVRSMELRRVREGGETVRRARAILVRDVGGELMTLDSTADREAPVALRAVLRTTFDGATSEVRTGDRVEHDGRIYVIGRMDLHPPMVEIGWFERSGAERSVELVLPATNRTAL